jgi:type IV secretory pathway TraG/TraD family ATPase VirD4
MILAGAVLAATGWYLGFTGTAVLCYLAAVVLLGLALGARLATVAGNAWGLGAKAGTTVWQLTPRGYARRLLGNGGWAGPRDLYLYLSLWAVTTTSKDTRPSVAAMPRAERRQLPATHHGVYHGRTVSGPILPWKVYSSYRDVIIYIAPPQTGKTAKMANDVIDAPGAVVVTSTKPDIYQHSVRQRAHCGPITVFNPEGIADLTTTLRWSPVAGCADPAVARERSGYLIAGAKPSQGVENGDFFENQAARVLRGYLMAAALQGYGYDRVAEWVNNPQDRTALEILASHTAVPVGWEGELAQVLGTRADRTLDSIFLAMSTATGFMADPKVAEACIVGPDDEQFDVETFLREHGTLYLLGSERPHASVAPLLTAFTGYLFETAKALAAKQPNGKLDPPMMFALDEAALICPVPLHRWTSDSGGRNIGILAAFQSPSQVYGKWGERDGQTIFNNANCTVYYGGLKHAADLEAISVMCGMRDEPAPAGKTTNGRGDESTSEQYRQVRVLPLDAVRRLPQWHVLVIHRSALPTVVKFRPVWKRRNTAPAGGPPDRTCPTSKRRDNSRASRQHRDQSATSLAPQNELEQVGER